MSFSKNIFQFYSQLRLELKKSKDISILDPFKEPATIEASKWYHDKFYKGKHKRVFLFGINPGRFGAGVTGIPFTDPIQMEELGYANDWNKRHELSALYVHEFITLMGGLDSFAENFYISSMSPLGFIKNGKNINYYDEKILQEETTPFILDSLQKQIETVCRTDVAFSLGQGKNFAFFHKLNEQEKLFDKIIPLPHPRWVMQYKRKKKDYYLKECVSKLQSML